MTFYNPYGNFSNRKLNRYKCNFHIHGLTREILKEYAASGYGAVTGDNFTGTIPESGVNVLDGYEYLEKDGILLIGVNRLIKGAPQSAVNECNGMGGFCVACHPNLAPRICAPESPALSRDEILSLEGLTGIEVFNGCLLENAEAGHGIGDPCAADVWDEALSLGRAIWGFGNDDSHGGAGINRAWTEVFAPSNRYADIYRAVGEGRLCASTGLTLLRFDCDGKELSVEAGYPDPDRRGHAVEYRFIGRAGRIISVQRGESGMLRLDSREPYVRAEALGDGGERLWTQPLCNLSNFNFLPGECAYEND